MQALIKSKVLGLSESLADFSNQVDKFDLNRDNLLQFSDMIAGHMKSLGFDEVYKDKAGNLIGVIKGYQKRQDMMLLSHADADNKRDSQTAGNKMLKFKAGIISSIYSGAALKRAMLPLNGDLLVCCVPHLELGDFGIKYLFDGALKDRIGRIKGVVLCEPTDFNVYLGHRGHLEYEIVVRGQLNRQFIENKGMNILGSMFPLINELEKVAKSLPYGGNMGGSDLKIKDVKYSGYRPQDDLNEFSVIVDRVFVQEEERSEILDRAKIIAGNIYKGEKTLTVDAAVTCEKVTTYSGLDAVLEKEIKPWSIDGHNRFVLDSLEVLGENGIRSNTGYWKNVFTDGAYTYGQLRIPTIGFGPGKESLIADTNTKEPVSADEFIKAVSSMVLIVERNIGMPAFGWSSDDI